MSFSIILFLCRKKRRKFFFQFPFSIFHSLFSALYERILLRETTTRYQNVSSRFFFVTCYNHLILPENRSTDMKKSFPSKFRGSTVVIRFSDKIRVPLASYLLIMSNVEKLGKPFCQRISQVKPLEFLNAHLYLILLLMVST